MALFDRRSEFLALLTFTLLFFAAYANALEDAQIVALKAPDSVNIFQTFPVKFTGPIAPGDIIRFADTQGKTLGSSYAYAGNAKNGAINLVAPIDPGAYQIVYLSKNEIVASKAVAPRYEVLDENENIVTEGLVKGDFIELAPGPYTVRILGVVHTVEIITEKRTTLSIDS